MSAEKFDTSPVEAPLARLERALIDEFVRARGYDPLKTAQLPDQQREQLLTEASAYASARLTEVESRSRFLDEIHDGVPGLSDTGLD